MSGGFPARGRATRAVLAEIGEMRARDRRYRDGRILNSICSQPLPIAVRAFCQAIETNLGDPRIFRGTREIEQATTAMLGSLLGHPGAVGSVVSGGTEANLLALLAARQRGSLAGISDPEVVVPCSAHFSIEKAAVLLGLRLRLAGLDARFRADPAEVERLIGPNTIAVVATAGTSELGAVDPVPEIAEIARRRGLYLHVDAASGGFLIPFARELGHDLPDFDFRIDGVDSLAVDPHKYGLSVIPGGWILFRSREVQRLVESESHYAGTPAHVTLSGTRSGASAAATYAVICSLGRAGFRKLVADYFAKRDYLIAELEREGFRLLVQPDLNIVAVGIADPERTRRRLEELGWIVSVSKRYQALRLVVHRHVTKADLRGFVEALARVEGEVLAGVGVGGS